MNVPNPYAQNVFPACIQTLTLVEGQVYIGASLSILVALIYDVLPHAQRAPFGPGDLEITTQMLDELKYSFWNALN